MCVFLWLTNSAWGFYWNVKLLQPNDELFLWFYGVSTCFAYHCNRGSSKSIAEWGIFMAKWQEVAPSTWRLFKTVLLIGEKRLQKGVKQCRSVPGLHWHTWSMPMAPAAETRTGVVSGAERAIGASLWSRRPESRPPEAGQRQRGYVQAV